MRPEQIVKRLYLLLILQLRTRKIVRWRVTEHPTREFVRQQIIDFTYDLPETVTLIHDNGSQFISIDFTQYNIKAVNTSVAAPNMNVYVERLIGSVRREALDHFLLFSENQVTRIISEYVNYYNQQRPHQGTKHIPEGESIPAFGIIQKKSILWGLHQHYYRSSA
jgi:transposase InsO family protein